MKVKDKLLTVLAAFMVLLTLAGMGAFKAKGNELKPVATAEDIKVLGGIRNRMTDNASFVFWQSTIGSKLNNYKSYKNIDEALCALRSGDISAMWTCDVTADYLCKANDDLFIIPTDKMSALENTSVDRFEFALAVKDNNEELVGQLNACISDMKSSGVLAELTDKYIENAVSAAVFSEKDMTCNGSGELVIGVTGAAAPIELVDEDGRVYGFCAAFMNEIGARLGKKVRFEVLDGETIFTSLMTGRIDAVFAYGTGMNTTENRKNYVMTDGYYSMHSYSFIGCMESSEENR